MFGIDKTYNLGGGGERTIVRSVLVSSSYMSCVMRKPTFCICENKDADQLRGNREADQRLCFRYIDSTIPLLSKIRNFKCLTIFCDCTARFVSDQVGNQNVGFLVTRLTYQLHHQNILFVLS